MTPPKRAFGYLRSSTVEEVRQGSNDRQKEIISRFCLDREYEVTYFEDRAKSGKDTDRPEFKRMMESIGESRPDLIIVTKIDRFARSLIDLLNTIENLQSMRIGFVSIQDPGIDTTTANGKLLLQILGAFAEFERNLINSRTRAGREKAKTIGVKFGRPALKTSSKNGGRFIDPRKVLELKERGLSARAISKSLGCSITPVLRVLNGD
ncbi:MAG: recombinase family protein [Thermoplasmataceae archaeon]